MKFHFRLTFSKLHLGAQKPADVVRLTRIMTTILVLSLVVWAGWFLYRTVIVDIVATKSVDPSLISAKEEKINRKLLDTVLQRISDRTIEQGIDAMRDPFHVP